MNILFDPNIVYLLLLAGTLLGLLAVVTPGTGGLEVSAFICLGLAGYAIAQLEFSWWALALLFLSILPFVFAIRKPKREFFLALSIGGLAIGSTYLFRSETWWKPAVNPILALFASIFYASFLWIAICKSVQAYRALPMQDLNMLVGQEGRATTHIHEEGSAHVSGELWSVRSSKPISAGRRVKVVARNGFVLDVEAESEEKNHF